MNLSGWQNKIRASIAVLAATAMALGGCDNMGGKKKKAEGSGGPAVATDNAQGGDKSPIRIGHYASMSGSEATFGVSTDNGIRLAVEERNKAGGVKGRMIEVITADTASKASEGGTAVTRLISQDKVVALLGEVSSSITLAGGDVAQKLGVPNISPSSTNVRVTDLGEMVSRVCFTDDFQAWVVAKFLRENLKIDRVATLYDQGQAYSKGFAEYFNKAFADMGGKVVANEAYAGGNPDASAQLQTIKGAGAQALFLPGYYGDAANFMKQAKSKGLTIPFIGGDGWDSVDLVKIAGDAANGHYFSNHYSHEETRPEVQSFVSAYKAKFGATPDGLAALGYDAARVLFDAMERAPSLDGRTLASAIAATKDFKGVTGSITMDKKRNAQKKAVIVQIQNGVPKLVTDIWPPGMEPKADGGAGSAAGSAAIGGAGNAPAEGAKDPDGKAQTRAPAKGAPAPGADKKRADPDEGGE